MHDFQVIIERTGQIKNLVVSNDDHSRSPPTKLDHFPDAELVPAAFDLFHLARAPPEALTALSQVLILWAKLGRSKTSPCSSRISLLLSQHSS